MPILFNALRKLSSSKVLDPMNHENLNNIQTVFLAHDGSMQNLAEEIGNCFRACGWVANLHCSRCFANTNQEFSRDQIKTEIRRLDWFFFVPTYGTSKNPEWLWMLGYAEAMKWRASIVMVPVAMEMHQWPDAHYFTQYSYLDKNDRNELFLFDDYSPKGKPLWQIQSPNPKGGVAEADRT